MSLNVTANLKLSVTTSETLATGLGTGTVGGTSGLNVAFANGTGANNINEYWSKDHTAAAAADTYTLSALTDAVGRTVAFAKIRLLMIVNLSTFPLTVGNAGTHPWAAPFDAATDTVKVPAGGCLLLVAPDSSGLAVASGTSDQLKIDPGANTVEYQITIFGE